ncbi:MAG: glutathione S-transferase family protein [Deltaproteobacteria bacterium]|nr:glutathione S-transferase family protein [Deltaproteobacteria bacterium]MDH4122055.1 glutathione S-transferase family protein [Deltaproteobacteria bacterium]
MADLTLVIGNKNTSSWSLRPWLVLKKTGVPFREVLLNFSHPEFKAQARQYSEAGKVPVLLDGPLAVWDSLAIMEYVNEAYAGGVLLPADLGQRARVRAVSAEMHSEFSALRRACPMKLLRTPAPMDPPPPGKAAAVRADIERVGSLWQSLREEHLDQGPWLFGAFTLADAMFLPVATRFHTYQLDLSSRPLAQAYRDTLLAMPEFAEWKQGAE